MQLYLSGTTEEDHFMTRSHEDALSETEETPTHHQEQETIPAEEMEQCRYCPKEIPKKKMNQHIQDCHRKKINEYLNIVAPKPKFGNRPKQDGPVVHPWSTKR